MRLGPPASEGEMIATFLKAEIRSSRFGPRLREALEAHGATEELVLHPDTSDARANRLRREVLVTFRGWGRPNSLFHRLPTDDLRWTWAELEEQDLRERTFYISWFWEEFSGGSRRPSEVAAMVRRMDPWAERHTCHEILDDVRRGAMPEPPILVSDPSLERLVILEGHLRVTAYLVEPEIVTFPIAALVGASPRVSEWSEW